MVFASVVDLVKDPEAPYPRRIFNKIQYAIKLQLNGIAGSRNSRGSLKQEEAVCEGWQSNQRPTPCRSGI
jgi:hypothetical protein